MREGRRAGHAEGRVVGAAEAVLKVIKKRGLFLDEASRDRILDERDPDRLSLWLERAVDAASVKDVLADGRSRHQGILAGAPPAACEIR
jgi:hypothetical protein